MLAHQPKKSSASVKVKFLEASIIIKQLREISKIILEKNKTLKEFTCSDLWPKINM